MVFVYLLAFSAFLLASVAGYFSIYGLASIFSGWFWEIIAMGVALEYGKLVTVSYLYRYGYLETRKGKGYFITAIGVLMLITSAGIFGFLSQGYQQDTLSLKQQEQRVELLISEQEEISTFKQESIDRKKQIDKDIAALPNNYITGRQRLMKSYGPELETLKKDIATYTKQINDQTLAISQIKQEKLINEVHIGPIIFIAQVFNADTDETVKWLIFMLIFAFDPLAVMLTLATNKVIMEHGKETKTDTIPLVDERLKIDGTGEESIVEKVIEPEPEPEVEPEPVAEPVPTPKAPVVKKARPITDARPAASLRNRK